MTADSARDPGDGAPVEHDLLGPYRLVQRLGEGGMGVVHLALDPHGRAVAVKVLRPHVAHDLDARARLAREVQTLERVRSPRVAPVIDADIEGDRPYIVTRYVPGPPLDEVIGRTGPMDAERLHRLGAGLAEALRVIHEAGVIHRDLKPGNVLLVDDDPVLIDFGIAHAIGDVRLTMTGLVMGTPGYLAPEVIEGDPVSRATDWWGWAATLAFAASGAPPFGRGAMEAVLARVTRGEPDLTGVDPRIAPLLYAALSPRPFERPHHGEVVTALARFAQGGPVTDAVELRRAADSTQAFAVSRTAVLPTRPPADAPRPRGGEPVVGLSSPPSAAPPRGPHAGPAAQGLPPGVLPAWASAPAPVPLAQSGPPGGPMSPPAAGIPPNSPAQAAWPVPQPVPPPRSLVPPPPAADPRIGRPTRSGTLLTLLGALVAAAAAVPTLAAILAVGWVIAARTIDRSVTSLVMRRHDRGVRSSDIPLAVLAGPWHLLVGLVSAVLSLVVPLVVGVSGAFVTALALSANGRSAEPTHPLALAAGALLAVLMAWWGPGGASLRRGTRSAVRGMTPGVLGARIVALVAIVAALVLVAWLVTTGSSAWWPRTGPPSFTGPSLG